MRTIEDVLKSNGYFDGFVTPDSSVDSALRLMTEEQVGALPVFEAGVYVGLIYEKDCISRALLNGRSIEEYRVTEIMSRNIVHISANQTIEEALALMTENQVHYLPVLVDSCFKGFVSMSELYQSIVDDQKEYVYRLENYILGFDYGR